jgi:hypothetical protein
MIYEVLPNTRKGLQSGESSEIQPFYKGLVLGAGVVLFIAA